ncbi:transmembrane protein 253 isoform X1 [Nothobranchius furzeri]|uniref:Transcript variant X1 n=1 Tax=Nothobranchius furzeri TaxID=105023 RepID=A0A9D2YPU0_NOTFU|nr:transcript variant X1 [Nothobranchius furzeri]
MRQNMFQEGLYQVFFKETHPPRQGTINGELNNARIHRWFGTVVNTRLLVTGLLGFRQVVQVFGALACILTTVSHACVSYDCSVSMITPVWSSLFYLAAGCLAMEVQRKANKLRIIALMGLNLFSLLFGFSALLANSLVPVTHAEPSSYHQRAGSYVAKVSSILFSIQCFWSTFYILFLAWRGLHRYSSPHIQAYSHISQDPEDTNTLVEEEVMNL